MEKKMRIRNIMDLLFGIVVLQTVLTSCDSGNDSTQEKESSDTGDDASISRSDHEGRGTSTCQDWQFAYCEYAYETCNFGVEGNMTACLKQYSSFVCLSDDIALSCTDALNSADCASVPQACMYQYVTDPVPAIEQCNEYIDAICERDVTCGGGTLDECREEYIPLIGCDEVIGTYLNFEECLPQLRELGCTEMVPEECETLFLAS
jgi:hypothetical protein